MVYDDGLLPRPLLTPQQQQEHPTPLPPAREGKSLLRFSHLSAAGATVIDFEGFECYTSIANQYAGLGVTFSGATILTLPPCLNPYFPPHSGMGVIYDWPTGTIGANFSTPVIRAGGYVTGNTVVTLECFDGSNVSLGTASLPGANYVGNPGSLPQNIFLEIVSPRIARCEFRDGGNTFTVDDFSFVPKIIVGIDIKPGSDPNSIQCNNDAGVIAVAILSTDDFDATTVDHTTVTFEGATETHLDKKTGLPRRHEEDVDGDGDIDLVFHFRFGDSNLGCASTEATLVGETFDGTAIEGTDAVRMVGSGGYQPPQDTDPPLIGALNPAPVGSAGTDASAIVMSIGMTIDDVNIIDVADLTVTVNGTNAAGAGSSPSCVAAVAAGNLYTLSVSGGEIDRNVIDLSNGTNTIDFSGAAAEAFQVEKPGSGTVTYCFIITATDSAIPPNSSQLVTEVNVTWN
jgi:hypothetical protein